jgi:hypothetical protein
MAKPTAFGARFSLCGKAVGTVLRVVQLSVFILIEDFKELIAQVVVRISPAEAAPLA